MRQVVFGIALTGVVVAAACGGGVSPTTPSDNPPNPGGGTGTGSVSVRWEWTGATWTASATPPACATPLTFRLPVDLSRVTAILYPGQSRPDYKPHGGFRFDLPGQTSELAYVAPQAGYVLRGARYLTSGEIQYTFDIVNSCGIMHRLGHLRDLSPRFLQLASAFPLPTEGDSRTTNVPAGELVTEGELIGTAVGLRNTANHFADWGVFDLRQRNASSANPSWLAAHSTELDAHAVCWFDYLSASEAATVRSLPPGDPTAGRTSDFCRPT